MSLVRLRATPAQCRGIDSHLMNNRVFIFGSLLASASLLSACRRHSMSQEEAFLNKLHSVEASNIWPGLSSERAPLLIRFGEEGALLSGLRPGSDSGFYPAEKKFPGIPTVSGGSYFKPGGFAPWLKVFNLDSFKLSGGEVYFSNYTLMRDLLNRDVLWHEYFHSYQKRWFNWKYDREVFSIGMSPEQAALAYIEQILLAKALTSTGDDWLRYAKAFAAVRAARKALPDKYSFNSREDAMEAIEGTAVYLETMAKDIDTSGLYTRPNVFDGITYPSQAYLHVAGELLMSEFTPDQMLYWRQYHTGAAQALLLDRARADWKSGVEKGASIFSIYSKVFAGLQGEKKEMVAAAKAAYAFPELVKAAKKTFFKKDVLFTGNAYSGRIVLNTETLPVIHQNTSPFLPKRYTFKNGESGELFANISLEHDKLFSVFINSFGVFHSAQKAESGKRFIQSKVSLPVSLSNLSIDDTACVADPTGYYCKRLDVYGLSSELHFNNPVRMSFKDKDLVLTVLP